LKPARLIAVLAALVALSLFAVACGDDDDEGSGSGSEETTQTESAKTVTLTADDTPEYSFELSATPTAETKTVKFKNEGKQFHVLIFARINEGFTLDEAFRMQGEGGSATEVGQAEAAPGKTTTVQITKPLKPGTYAMLCPIGGPQGPHYKLGQLQEFEIQ
jgi:plastocyanin